jgi:hypothetical protein
MSKRVPTSPLLRLGHQSVVGDGVRTCRGGWDDVRKTLAAAAMMRAAVLAPMLALLLPNDSRPGCVDAGEGRTDPDWDWYNWPPFSKAPP